MFTRKGIEALIEEMKKESRKLRLVCTCSEFDPGEGHPYLAMRQCQQCHGWLTIDQLTFHQIPIKKEEDHGIT